MIRLTDILKHDVKQQKTIVLVDKLVAYVPLRYEQYDLLHLQDVVTTLGIFELEVVGNPTKIGLCLPAMIHTAPIRTYSCQRNDMPHLALEYGKGSELLTSMSIIKNGRLGYVIWHEFMEVGNMPNFLSYDQKAFLFDLVAKTCGLNFPVNHAVFEMIMARLHRQQQDLTKEYRYDLKSQATMVKLRSVSYGPSTASAKIMGSYMDDGLNSAMVNASDGEASRLETILCS